MKALHVKGSSTLFKSTMLAGIISLSSWFTSCQATDPISSQEVTETQPVAERTQQVSFSLSTFIPQQTPITRAASQTIGASPTRLLVLDVVDGMVKQTLERTSQEVQASQQVEKVDNVLSDFSMTLTCGTHHIYLLAAANPYNSYDTSNLHVSWNETYRLTFVWAQMVQVEVGQSATSAQSVNLPLVVGMVSLTCNDAAPQEAATMKISGNFHWTLDLSTMTGVAPTTPWNYTISISKKEAGINFVSFNFAPADNLGSITYTALDSSNKPITSHQFSDVPLTVGYITNYVGLFYNYTQEFSLSCVNQWTQINKIDY